MKTAYYTPWTPFAQEILPAAAKTTREWAVGPHRIPGVQIFYLMPVYDDQRESSNLFRDDVVGQYCFPGPLNWKPLTLPFFLERVKKAGLL